MKLTNHASRALNVTRTAAALLLSIFAAISTAAPVSAAINITGTGSTICSNNNCVGHYVTNLTARTSFVLDPEVAKDITADSTISLWIDESEIPLRINDDPAYKHGATKATIRKKVELFGVLYGPTELTAVVSWANGKFSLNMQATCIYDTDGGAMIMRNKSNAPGFDLEIVIQNPPASYSKGLRVPTRYTATSYEHNGANDVSESRGIEKMTGSVRHND